METSLTKTFNAVISLQLDPLWHQLVHVCVCNVHTSFGHFKSVKACVWGSYWADGMNFVKLGVVPLYPNFSIRCLKLAGRCARNCDIYYCLYPHTSFVPSTPHLYPLHSLHHFCTIHTSSAPSTPHLYPLHHFCTLHNLLYITSNASGSRYVSLYCRDSRQSSWCLT